MSTDSLWKEKPVAPARWCESCRYWVIYPCVAFPEDGLHVGCGGKLLKERPIDG